MSLDAQIAFFKNKQVDLAEKHHGKVVLIYAKKVVGVYESELEAYTDAKNKYGTGGFLIRKCLKPEEETPQVFHSRVAG